MSYETIDWELEAAHLKKVFGIAGNCWWRNAQEYHHDFDGKILWVGSVSSSMLLCTSGDRITVVYTERGLSFELYRLTERYCSAYLTWDEAAPQMWVAKGANITTLNRALYRLVALSPEVAAAMNVSARNGNSKGTRKMSQNLASLEWSREQIATAFEIDGTITASHINLNDPDKSFSAMHELRGHSTGLAWLRITTFARHIRFKILPFARAPKAECLFIHCTKAGAVVYVVGDMIFALAMIKALTCLGIDTLELERAAGLTIAAHQKVEWLLDYDKRLNEI